jgi:hypothetical protein
MDDVIAIRTHTDEGQVRYSSWTHGSTGRAGRSPPRIRSGSRQRAKPPLTAGAKRKPHAEGVGAQLGELAGLAEPEAGQMLRRRSGGWFAASAGHDMPVETGEQEVTATIVVTFALIS